MDNRLTSIGRGNRSVALFRYKLPLMHAIQVGGRSIHQREGLLVRLRDADGLEGWGEAAPLPGFSKESLQEVITSACRWEEGRATVGPPSLAFAIDSALVELESFRPNAEASVVSEHVRVNGLISDLEDAEDRAAALVADGFDVIKMKVGQRTLVEDAERVRRVVGSLPPRSVLRLDANRAWDLASALTFFNRVEGLAIEYVEEPLQDVADLERLAQRTSVPIALDETVREIEPDELDRFHYVGAAVLKPSLMGGMSRYQSLVRAANGIGARIVLSGAFETGVGLRSLVRLAASLREDVACGFEPYLRLARDVIAPRVMIENGRIDTAAALAPRDVLLDKLTEVRC